MKWVAAPVALSAVLMLAGCTPEQMRGYLPENSTYATNHTEGITGLWVTSWIVLLAVGVITWGLIIWATVVYRRRKGQTGLPVQMRYNMPIEAFFTVVPVILVVGFFAFTAKEMDKIEARYENPDNVVEVIGKRWSWDFNYKGDINDPSDDAYFQGIQVETDADGEAKSETMPKLVLPVNQKTEIRLETRDVIHSFWVVEFLYKKDMIPGQTNYMSIEPTQEGTYMGKCAELCGEYHSMMLFEVEVVSQDKYDDYIKSLQDAGQSGAVSTEYNANGENYMWDGEPNDSAKTQNFRHFGQKD